MAVDAGKARSVAARGALRQRQDRFRGAGASRGASSPADTGVPLVAVVFPVATLAAGDLVEARDELDAHDVLRVLVAELAFDAQADRRAILHGKRLVVQLVRQDRLRVISIIHVDAFVVRARTVGFHRVGAMEDDEARLGLWLDRIQHRGELDALPLADRAPALDAIVPGDLRAAGQLTQLRQRERGRPPDQSLDLELIVGEAIRDHGHVLRVVWLGRAIAAKTRRQIRGRKFLRHRPASAKDAVHFLVEALARAEEFWEPFGLRQLLASRK